MITKSKVISGWVPAKESFKQSIKASGCDLDKILKQVTENRLDGAVYASKGDLLFDHADAVPKRLKFKVTLVIEDLTHA